MPKVRVNGTGIYYESRGDGFPLVMIMGLGGNIDWWPPELLDRLAQRYMLLVFDNRGAGRSDAPAVDYSISMFARDTVDLMSLLGIKRAHVFGVSMGGMIAQEMALSYPGRVEKLVLGCTNCGPGHSVPAPAEVIALLLNQSAAPPAEILKILFPEDYIAQNMDKIGEFVRRYTVAPIAPEAHKRQLGAIAAFNSYDRLARITAPTLVITGDRDVLIPPENSEILARNIPGARMITVKGCGHGFVGQAPDEVFEMLQEFLEVK
ncbi:MAG: alpha/beta fold hydrolase [Bacillota bacterium]